MWQTASTATTTTNTTNANTTTTNNTSTTATPTTTTNKSTTTPSTETPAAEPPQVTRQKYEEAKHELQALLARKKQVDTNLVIQTFVQFVLIWLISVNRLTWRTPFIYSRALTWKILNKMETLFVVLMAI